MIFDLLLATSSWKPLLKTDLHYNIKCENWNFFMVAVIKCPDSLAPHINKKKQIKPPEVCQSNHIPQSKINLQVPLLQEICIDSCCPKSSHGILWATVSCIQKGIEIMIILGGNSRHLRTTWENTHGDYRYLEVIIYFSFGNYLFPQLKCVVFSCGSEPIRELPLSVYHCPSNSRQALIKWRHDLYLHERASWANSGGRAIIETDTSIFNRC